MPFKDLNFPVNKTTSSVS